MDERDEGLPVVDPTQVDASLHAATHAKPREPTSDVEDENDRDEDEEKT